MVFIFPFYLALILKITILEFTILEITILEITILEITKAIQMTMPLMKEPSPPNPWP
jgi:hypothetical protein